MKLETILIRKDGTTFAAHTGSHKTRDFQGIKTDADQLFTLERMSDLTKKVESIMGIEVDGIEVRDWRFYDRETGKELLESIDEDFAYITRKKEYLYDKKSNCLTIWKDEKPVYENNNGIICKDEDALADCLC